MKKDVVEVSEERAKLCSDFLNGKADFADVSAGWLPWSQWSECVNGEKMRYRSCIPSAHINCVGMKVEKQPCVVEIEAIEIPFASDPWVIEREISFRGFNRPDEA